MTTKTKLPKCPKGWRRLRLGEIIRPGDKWSWGDKGYSGGPVGQNEYAGNGQAYRPGSKGGCHCPHIRRIRKPTRRKSR